MLRLLLLLLLLSTTVFAQPDSISHTLTTAEIVATKRNFRASFLSSQQLDTSRVNQLSAFTLSDRLDREAGIFVKSYGSAGISTLSLRGTGASHTAVVWQGMTLNSPMLGLTDLNLIPSFLVDDIQITYGGNGPLNGNGAIGGTISLNNPLSTAPGLRFNAFAGGGSFGLHREGLGFKWSNGKVVTQNKVYAERHQNNFSYQRPDGTMIRQTHAGTAQFGFTQDLRLGSGDRFAEAHVWYLKNNREIPPLMISEISRQDQQDETIRASLQLNRLYERRFIKLLSGFSQEYIHYRDPAAQLDEKSKARMIQSELEGGLIFGSYWRFIAQAGYQYATAAVESYSAPASQQQWSLAGNLMFEKGKVKAQAALRQSIFNNDVVPLLPSASCSVLLNRYFTFRGDIAGVYRLPTLNDRFWQPGGNRDLSPEKGYSSSLGISMSTPQNNIMAEVTGNVFLSHLKAAIVWLPGADGIYTVDNIQVLDSKGAEGNVRLSMQTGNWNISVGGGAAYTKSVISETDASNAVSLDQQIIYTPLVLWKGNLCVRHKEFSFRYYHTYTGYRYVTTDHAHFLPPYDVAACTLSWDHPLGKHHLLIMAGIKNIYNISYQVIAWRAMPGRSFETGIFYTFGQR